MMKKKSVGGTSYNLFLIPEDSRGIKKIRISPRHLRILTVSGLITILFLVFNIVGFWYYRTLYASLEKDRITYKAYEQERESLAAKGTVLGRTVGEAEKLTGRLASLVGTGRVSMQKGVGGPIPGEDFDVTARTQGVDLASLDPEMERIGDRAINLQAKIKELTKVQEDKLIYIASTPSIWPVKGWVTSDFGYRRSPFTFAADFHPGVDIAASWGTPVVAPADGVVTFSGYKSGYGKTVIIDHGFGVVTQYGHASELFAQEGEKIKRGAKIALVGSTGHSTGPHLHYEIHVDSVPVDPMKYILK